ncbi:MAG TPA: DNA helicase PcrA [Clostridiales bacterium]|nr:MAG: ATP-dependent DNA helicase PcrA [Clostridiales bacterium GWD2_32_19]HCC06857.1 DNA helicase PcrA [Clostridiales bacterium]
MDLLKGLNDKQKEAVLHMEGSLLILAGAGSGKTKVLTNRIAYLIQEKKALPSEILAITFTNKAASEMKERVEKLVGKDSKDIWISTFHSMCVRILRQTIHNIGYTNQFTIYDADDQKKLVSEVIKELGYDDKIYPSKKALNMISTQKNDFITPEQYENQMLGDFVGTKYANIYRLYQEKLEKNNSLDFDDLIFKTIQVLKGYPEVGGYYQERFKYILVDEYQDTNNSQFILIETLGLKHRNVCVVGDPDQSIYKWRGANIRNILDFETNFEESKTIMLEENYRCTKVILDAANEVIKNNCNRREKSLWTMNDEGEKIVIYNALDDRDEGNFVANTIIREVEAGNEDYNSFAILYRTNAQSRVLEEAFINKNIPYQLFGGVKFYERKEIKDILSYLKLIINSRDNIALDRIINVPRRGIGDTSIDRIAAYAKENKKSMYEALLVINEISELRNAAIKIAGFTEIIESIKENIESKKIAEIVEMIIDKTSYINVLKAEGTDEARDRIENIYQFIAKAQEYDETREEGTLSNFLEEVSLVADIDNYEEKNNSVKLMTLHSAKGLEFPHVFISGVEEGIFPSYMSLSSDDGDEQEEERRICYVGITRARKQLYITYANARRQFGKTVFNTPSRFLAEIPDEYKNDLSIKRDEVKEKTKKPKKEVKKYTNFSTTNYNILVTPTNVDMDFKVGDSVEHDRFGHGVIDAARPAGADYELTINFEILGVKKLMSKFANLKKI